MVAWNVITNNKIMPRMSQKFTPTKPTAHFIFTISISMAVSKFLCSPSVSSVSFSILAYHCSTFDTEQEANATGPPYLRVSAEEQHIVRKKRCLQIPLLELWYHREQVLKVW